VRTAEYKVSSEQLAGATYPIKAIVELKAAMVPVNLIDAIKDVGFDYELSPRDIAEVLVHGHIDEEGEVVIWNEDSDDPADNQVAGHQVVWQREVELVQAP